MFFLAIGGYEAGYWSPPHHCTQPHTQHHFDQKCFFPTETGTNSSPACKPAARDNSSNHTAIATRGQEPYECKATRSHGDCCEAIRPGNLRNYSKMYCTTTSGGQIGIEAHQPAFFSPEFGYAKSLFNFPYFPYNQTSQGNRACETQLAVPTATATESGTLQSLLPFTSVGPHSMTKFGVHCSHEAYKPGAVQIKPSQKDMERNILMHTGIKEDNCATRPQPSLHSCAHKVFLNATRLCMSHLYGTSILCGASDEGPHFERPCRDFQVVCPRPVGKRIGYEACDHSKQPPGMWSSPMPSNYAEYFSRAGSCACKHTSLRNIQSECDKATTVSSRDSLETADAPPKHGPKEHKRQENYWGSEAQIPSVRQASSRAGPHKRARGNKEKSDAPTSCPPNHPCSHLCITLTPLKPVYFRQPVNKYVHTCIYLFAGGQGPVIPWLKPPELVQPGLGRGDTKARGDQTAGAMSHGPRHSCCGLLYCNCGTMRHYDGSIDEQKGFHGEFRYVSMGFFCIMVIYLEIVITILILIQHTSSHIR